MFKCFLEIYMTYYKCIFIYYFFYWFTVILKCLFWIINNIIYDPVPIFTCSILLADVQLRENLMTTCTTLLEGANFPRMFLIFSSRKVLHKLGGALTNSKIVFYILKLFNSATDTVLKIYIRRNAFLSTTKRSGYMRLG